MHEPLHEILQAVFVWLPDIRDDAYVDNLSLGSTLWIVRALHGRRLHLPLLPAGQLFLEASAAEGRTTQASTVDPGGAGGWGHGVARGHAVSTARGKQEVGGHTKVLRHVQHDAAEESRDHRLVRILCWYAWLPTSKTTLRLELRCPPILDTVCTISMELRRQLLQHSSSEVERFFTTDEREGSVYFLKEK